MTPDFHKLNRFIVRVGRIHIDHKELTGSSSMDYRRAGLALIEKGVSYTLCSLDSDLIPYPESWQEWNALVEKYPGNMDAQMLHALKIGLCVKISQGSISTEAAITLFNYMVDTLIEKRNDADGQGKKDL